jgi:hypothetical protein
MDIATNDSMDPVLEVSIDDRGSPAVIVQLVGALDHTTRACLSSRMEKLLIEGDRDFVMDLERAFVDASGALALVLIERRVRESGGTLLWRELDSLRFGVTWKENRRWVIDGCRRLKASMPHEEQLWHLQQDHPQQTVNRATCIRSIVRSPTR